MALSHTPSSPNRPGNVKGCEGQDGRNIEKSEGQGVIAGSIFEVVVVKRGLPGNLGIVIYT